MIRTNYPLPYVFEAPTGNPWDGQRQVEVWVETQQPMSNEDAETLQNYVFPFWLLASGGALAGDGVPPERSSCEQPTFSSNDRTACFLFEQCELDERASLCLLSLLLVVHEEVPLSRVRIHASGLSHSAVPSDPGLDNPYPGMPARPPFALTIEDSESDVRTLHVTWKQELDEAQREQVNAELGGFGASLLAGAFGVAPVSPSECSCTPSENAEWDGPHMSWVMEDCRFHWAALECLLTLCASLAQRIAAIAEVVIE